MDENWRIIEHDKLKMALDVLGVFVDIVSKNGNLLFNIGPNRRGEIPDDYRDLLLSFFATRPSVVFGEGPTLASGRASEYVVYGEKDFSFVRSQDSQTLSITDMKWPATGGYVLVTTLGKGSIDLKSLKTMSLPGHRNVTYEQGKDGLNISLPVSSGSTSSLGPHGRRAVLLLLRRLLSC